MTPTLMAMIGFGLWTLLLSMTIAATRSAIMMRSGRPANGFSPTGEDLGGFPRRLARAHANCCENLPIFVAIALGVVLSGHSAVADRYALWVLYARIFQSLIHLASTSVPAVYLRFAFYLVQVLLLVLMVVGAFAG
ncbi:MAG: MAPEG family protein [Alphaproteobacteria bacterium]|nr:MAPEG family protein [Alphaproteobacteria bacterium]